MNKDWTGNKHSVFTCLGASNHTESIRETNDFYATAPEGGEWLLQLEPQIDNVWMPFVGQGHLAEPYRKADKLKAVSDLIDRGYYPEGIMKSYGKDFMTMNKVWNGDIVDNPPYKDVTKYVKHCLDLINDGHWLALFMKITFLEGKERKEFFKKFPPVRVWVSSSRILCAKNGEFEYPKTDKDGNVKSDKNGNPIMTKMSSASCYCWFVWQKGHKGDTVLKWFN